MKFGSTVLFVDNVQSVLEFYKTAFGMEISMYDPAYDFGILNMEGGSIGIASNHSGELMMPGKFPSSKNGHPDGVEIALYSEDVEADYKKAIDAGAGSLSEPRQMEWGQTVAYVKSIEGTIIGICSEMPEH